MTRGSDYRSDLALIADKIGRHNEDLEKVATDNASDMANVFEKLETATARYGRAQQEAYNRYCQEVSSILGSVCNATNARLVTAGIVPPQDDVASIAKACRPDMSRIEAKKQR